MLTSKHVWNHDHILVETGNHSYDLSDTDDVSARKLRGAGHGIASRANRYKSRVLKTGNDEPTHSSIASPQLFEGPSTTPRSYILIFTMENFPRSLALLAAIGGAAYAAEGVHLVNCQNVGNGQFASSAAVVRTPSPVAVLSSELIDQRNIAAMTAIATSHPPAATFAIPEVTQAYGSSKEQAARSLSAWTSSGILSRRHSLSRLTLVLGVYSGERHAIW